jgi:Right handed beta helix region
MMPKFANSIFVVLLGFLGILTVSLAQGATIYVSPVGVGDGTTPATPAGLQAALDTAKSTAGNHDLLLKQGTYDAKAATGYKVTVLNNDTDKSITLDGGWDDTYTSQSLDPSVTKLDGGGSPTGVRVLELFADGGGGKNKFYLKRLSVENGYALAIQGGGISADVTNGGLLELNVEKCILKNNLSRLATTGGLGGAIYSTVPLEVSETTFESNSTNYHGAGIFATYRPPSYTNAISAKFDRCTFLNNTIVDCCGQGSAIYSTVTLTVTKSIFEGQTGTGSPIFSAFGGAPNMSVSDSKFYNNQITYWGGAIQFWMTGGEIKNCLFIQNQAGNGGDGYGAITYYDNTGSPNDIKITNCTFSGNHSTIANDRGGAIHNRGANLIIYNSIFWENGPEGIYNESGTTTLAYSDSQSGFNVTDGGNNLDPAAQCFVGSGDYSLGAASPCIDAGTNTPTGITLPPTDYAGNTRIIDGNEDGLAVVDMGAFEFGIVPTAITSPATGITASGAILNGTVNPKGNATDYYFEWGTGTAYGSTTPTQSAGSETGDVIVSGPINSLTPNNTYHFRLVAVSSIGTTNGEDQAFQTAVIYYLYLPLILR